MRGRLHYITRPILVLSVVSLFNDMASEMLYPIMPLFLESIGFSILLIGILEGVAEMTSGLSKGYFGQLSDIRQKRLPFVHLGYALSTIAKPLFTFFTAPVWIFFVRTVDRFGKGIRTAPRDAMLSDNTTAEYKGRVFGFHRSMDTFGAVLGPLAALLFLYFYPADYNTLFLLAFIPGCIAVLFTFRLKEEKRKPKEQKVHFFSYFTYLRTTDTNSPKANDAFKKLLLGLCVFALVNSSDVLLLLKMRETGIDEKWIIGIYIFYNLVYALSALPMGILADKMGLKPVFITGLFIFGLVYSGFIFSDSRSLFFILFFLYGLYAAMTEGIAKAWISNVVPASETGTAIGLYTALSSIGAFIASSLAGWLWFAFGSAATFGLSASMMLPLMLWFSFLRSGRKT
ncbi:MAG: MFS transporter [Chitinophagales bacterium]